MDCSQAIIWTLLGLFAVHHAISAVLAAIEDPCRPYQCYYSIAMPFTRTAWRFRRPSNRVQVLVRWQWPVPDTLVRSCLQLPVLGADSPELRPGGAPIAPQDSSIDLVQAAVETAAATRSAVDQVPHH